MTTQERVLDGLAKFIERRGYEVLDKNYKGFMVYRDVYETCFASVSYQVGGKEFPICDTKREDFEKVFIEWVKDHPETPEGLVRFDALSVLIVSKEKMIIQRHPYINLTGEAEYAEA